MLEDPWDKIIKEEKEADPILAEHLREFRVEFQALIARWQETIIGPEYTEESGERFLDFLRVCINAMSDIDETAESEYFAWCDKHVPDQE